jgi:hypothetical protein
VQADGKRTKMDSDICAGDHASYRPFLRNLPAFQSITSISPSSATARGSQFLLNISGNDFRRDSVVNCNGFFVVTTFVSSRQLIAVITAADIAQRGTVAVFVFNPPEGGTTFVSGGIGVMSATSCSGKTSNAVSFTINP